MRDDLNHSHDMDRQEGHRGDGVDRRGFLECMAWAGTGLVWVAAGGILSSRTLGQAAAAYFFLHFLVILPLVSAFETPLPLPKSITDSVLHGEAAEAAPAGQTKPRRGSAAPGG